jgi:BAHD acyltransferase
VFRVEYDDDMEGVEVLEAKAEWISVEDLTVEEGTSTLKELIPYSGILNSEGLHRPLLSVQVAFPLFFIHIYS